jgi:glycerol uptake facilitator-like aquaporin
MWEQPFVRDVVFFTAAALVGLIVAAMTTPKGVSTRPVWAVRLYLWIFRMFPGLGAISKRSSFNYREQFLATFFITFFIVFGISAVSFGCGYRVACA